MASIIAVGHIEAKDKKSRDRLISMHQDATTYAWSNVGYTTRYITGVPVDDNNTSLYVIAEFTSQQAYTAHFQASSTAAFFSALNGGKYTSSSPKWKFLNTSHSYQRPGHVAATASTHIVLANFGYHPGYTSYALQGWKDYAEYCKAYEAPALAYAVLEDTEESKIRTVQIFESKEYVRDVHLKTEGLRRNQQQNGAYRNGDREIAKLRVVQGFLGRS